VNTKRKDAKTQRRKESHTLPKGEPSDDVGRRPARLDAVLATASSGSLRAFAPLRLCVDCVLTGTAALLPASTRRSRAAIDTGGAQILYSPSLLLRGMVFDSVEDSASGCSAVW
jgi:hypothetical protein